MGTGADEWGDRGQNEAAPTPTGGRRARSRRPVASDGPRGRSRAGVAQRVRDRHHAGHGRRPRRAVGGERRRHRDGRAGDVRRGGPRRRQRRRLRPSPATGDRLWEQLVAPQSPMIMGQPVADGPRVVLGYGFGNLGGRWTTEVRDAGTGATVSSPGGGLVDGLRGRTLLTRLFASGRAPRSSPRSGSPTSTSRARGGAPTSRSSRAARPAARSRSARTGRVPGRPRPQPARGRHDQRDPGLRRRRPAGQLPAARPPGLRVPGVERPAARDHRHVACARPRRVTAVRRHRRPRCTPSKPTPGPSCGPRRSTPT